MENNFVTKFIMKGITKDLQKDNTYKGQKIKKANLSNKVFFEISKHLSNKAIKVKISSISKKRLENIHKNEKATKVENITQIENIKDKHFKGSYTRYLFDMLNNNNKAFKYKGLENINTKERQKDYFYRKLQKSTSYKTIKNHKLTTTSIQHKESIGVMNFEDITQTTFLLLLEYNQYIYTYSNKVIITKYAKRQVFKALQRYLSNNMQYNKDMILFQNYTNIENNDNYIIDKQSYSNYINDFNNTISKIKANFNLQKMYKDLKFTNRQVEILNMLCNKNMNEISKILGISRPSVYIIIKRLKDKIQQYYIQLV